MSTLKSTHTEKHGRDGLEKAAFAGGLRLIESDFEYKVPSALAQVYGLLERVVN